MKEENEAVGGMNSNDLTEYIRYYKDESFLRNNIHLDHDTVGRLKGKLVTLSLGVRDYYLDIRMQQLVPKDNPDPQVIIPLDFNEFALRDGFTVYMDTKTGIALTRENMDHFQHVDEAYIRKYNVPDLSKIDPVGFDYSFRDGYAPYFLKEAKFKVKLDHAIKERRLDVNEKEYFKGLREKNVEAKVVEHKVKKKRQRKL